MNKHIKFRRIPFFKEKSVGVFRPFKDNRRLAGILLIVLGAVLAIISRTAGGSPFQDFTSGVLMGLSVGILLTGIIVALSSFARK